MLQRTVPTDSAFGRFGGRVDLLGDDLATLVEAAGAAGAVRQRRGAAVIAGDELHRHDLVVLLAAHLALARGLFPLRDGHDAASLFASWTYFAFLGDSLAFAFLAAPAAPTE